jgi:glycosyltransferase involved in cell wall biosynthesis
LHVRLFRKVYPELPAGKFATVPNGFDEAEWGDVGVPTVARGVSQPNSFVVRYTGSFYQNRNPLPLFRALRALLDSGEIDRKHFTIDLVGWCDVAEDRRVREMAEECRVADCVTFTGPLSRAETLRRITQADLLLLLAEAQPYQIPGKTYEYLRAGRPILALTSDGALSDLLRNTGGAWVVNPGDHAGIVGAVQEAYGRWKKGQAGPGADRAMVNTFDRRLLAGRLAKLFDDACRTTN